MTDQKFTNENNVTNFEARKERSIGDRYEIVYGTDSRVNIDSLLDFETVSWEPEEQAERESLLERLDSFPEGISMLYDIDPTDNEEKPMAQFTVAPKDIPEKIEGFAQMRDMKTDYQSDTLWGTNLGRRQGEIYNGRGYATEIVKNRLNWAIEHGYKKFMAGMTCDGLKEALAGYEKRKKDGSIVQVKIEADDLDQAAKKYMELGMNPTVNTFVRAAKELGLRVETGTPIAEYWPENETSLGYAVMLTIYLENEQSLSESVEIEFEEKIEFSYDLDKPCSLGIEDRETISGLEKTAFYYLPAKGCENNCAFCSVKHVKAPNYKPSLEQSIFLANALKVFLKENTDVKTIKLFNGGNILHGSEHGDQMATHEYFWEKLVESLEDLQKTQPGVLKTEAIELEIRLDDLVESDDVKKLAIQKRVIDLRENLSKLGIELRLILAYEYVDQKIIDSQGKFSKADDYIATINSAQDFLQKHEIQSLAYAMFGGRVSDRPMRASEAVDAALNTIKFGLNEPNGPREVIVNCQYLDPLQQAQEVKTGKQLYVPQEEDFVRLLLLLRAPLEDANGKRVRISYEVEETIVGTKGVELRQELKEILNQFNQSENQAKFLAENFEEIQGIFAGDK